MTDKEYNKLVNQIVKSAILAEYPIATAQEVHNRYNSILEQYGVEKADSALQYTLKRFKEMAKEKDKAFWQAVKAEVFQKEKSCPCAIRDLKTMIKTGDINITGYTKEQEIKTRLEII